eukprot:11831.XXX_726460_726594_1 [CDS] Oithona nana genome sequencing.
MIDVASKILLDKNDCRVIIQPYSFILNTEYYPLCDSSLMTQITN